MVPFAISAAASVRVGRVVSAARPPAEGRCRRLDRHRPGSIFHAVRVHHSARHPAHTIARAFTSDPGVIAAAVPLLLVAAAFQFFDGLQITATGALRGAGNTHTGLFVHLCGYWVIGMPVGILLGFHYKLGAVGLWTGLCTGLIFAGAALIGSWYRTAKKIETTISAAEL